MHTVVTGTAESSKDSINNAIDYDALYEDADEDDCKRRVSHCAVKTFCRLSEKSPTFIGLFVGYALSC
jgi:hypothetical protein